MLECPLETGYVSRPEPELSFAFKQMQMPLTVSL